ncbi:MULTISPECIES: winged helix-turn-helix transcriptional regulator [Gordonia]|uniref:Putative HxlR family transcriptional regulator n=1 Tax=Gordonia sihwensis NBRC 108236 TaxID=1223544 RepID=L7LL77_9ACTN|nr:MULTISPECIES: helix-turn-helix domain-containing protein [Gordonia]AUH68013.1 transcriptional regulator [Gordonia sp. YC-JH1]KXT58936.1 HxlR family transcriptional regulator [Gordonia sp. QH-12]MBY4569348.1 transcriptional regulator [Gordonia sihwensis]GAC61900.1 putative HxlR family transcriptional regulator [Gordonia sihwensis NBRC 108236]
MNDAQPTENIVDPSLEADVFSRNCSSREILQNVTSRWGLLALVALLDGELRFNALRRRVDGVSERMLSVTLQSLERDGYVRREMLQAIPPRVEYSLTEAGTQVAQRLSGLIELVEAQVDEVAGARAAYDGR